jgi:hypothetical protein
MDVIVETLAAASAYLTARSMFTSLGLEGD